MHSTALLLMVLLLSRMHSVLSSCRNNCNMHGTCNSASVCTCFPGWDGNDCSLRACPRGPILGDIATGIDQSHQMEQCSGRGGCNTRTGECECDAGWSGLSCGKMACINDCSGHGQCLSLYDAAALNDGFQFNRSTTYNRWDAHMFHGCKCDPTYTGTDCSLRSCEAGPDPRRTETVSKKYETATLVCRCAAGGCLGKFKLNFMGQRTGKWLLPTSTGRDVANLLLGYAPRGTRASDGERQGNFRFAQNDTRISAQPAVWAGMNDGPPVTGAGESSLDPDLPDQPICRASQTTYTNINFKRYAYDLPALSVYASTITQGSVVFETFQTLTCDCTANNCNGTFRATFDGEISRKMFSMWNATSLTSELTRMRTVQSAGISRIAYLNRTLNDLTPFCQAGQRKTHTFVFTAPFGNVARIGIWSAIGPPTEDRYTNMRSASYRTTDTTRFPPGTYKTQYYSTADIERAAVLQLTTNDGRDNNLHECNGIGSCDYGTGVCQCPFGWTNDPDLGPCGRLSSNSSSANGAARCPGLVHSRIDTNLGYYPSRDSQPSRPRVFMSSNRKDGVSPSRLFWHEYKAEPPEFVQPTNDKYQTGRALLNLTSAASAGPIAYDAAAERLFFVDNNIAAPFIGYVSVKVNTSTNFDYYYTNGDSTLPLAFTVFVTLSEPAFGLTFDPTIGERRLYWTLRGSANYHDGRIGSASVDDERRPAGVQYMSSQVGDAFHIVDPMGIAMHPRKPRLYWVDRCCAGNYRNVINSANIRGDPRRETIFIDRTVGNHTSTTLLSYTDIVIDWLHNNTALVLDDGSPPALVAVPLDNVTISDLRGARVPAVQMRAQRLVAGGDTWPQMRLSSQLGALTVDAEHNVVMWTDATSMQVNYEYVESRASVLGYDVPDLGGSKNQAFQRAYLGDLTGDRPVGIALDFGMNMLGFADGDYLECHGNGVCGGHEANFRCLCFDGGSGDCSQRQCPKGRAWWHEPLADEVAHDVDAECSNAGVCDRTSGRCACAAGFEGEACERASCRGQTLTVNSCGGSGRCLSMRELARRRKTPDLVADPSAVYGSKAWSPLTWGADMIQGCIGDEYLYMDLQPGTKTKQNSTSTHTGRGGFGLECPYGLDHREDELAHKNDTAYLTRTQWVDARLKRREVQRVLCTADAGTFRLIFRNYTTQSTAWNASPQTLQSALEALPSIGSVQVLTKGDLGYVCSANTATAQYFDVVFLTELSRVPLLILSDSLTHASAKVFSVSRLAAGSGAPKECSGKGECDRTTGICQCWPAWGSSDGIGGRGTRGDCGFSLAL